MDHTELTKVFFFLISFLIKILASKTCVLVRVHTCVMGEYVYVGLEEHVTALASSWVQIWFYYCVVRGKWLSLSEPQSSHL